MVTIQLIRLALTQQIMNQLQIGEYEQLVHQASESVGRGLIWERKALLPDDKDTEILRDERDFDAIVEVYKASFKHVGELINKLKHGLKVPMAAGTTYFNSEQAALSAVHARPLPTPLRRLIPPSPNSGRAVPSPLRV